MSAIVVNVSGWLLRASWQAAVLVALVWLVQLAFRKRLGARWRYSLWLLVMARLLLPASPQSRLSLFNLAPPAVARVQPAPSIAAEKTISSVPAQSVSEPVPENPSMVVTAAERPEAYSATPEPERPAKASPHSWNAGGCFMFLWKHFGAVCVVIWGIGVGVLGLRLVMQNLVLIRRLRGAKPVEDMGTLALFEQSKTLMGIGFPVGLVETDEVKSPALHGYFRPRLLLPSRWIGGFSQQELRYVFLHELAHVRRHDMAVHWVATVFKILHWFNPVLWFGFRRMAADRELACDEMALGYAGEQESKPYGEAIIKVLEVCEHSPSLAGAMGILESRDQMTRRIAMILAFKRRSRWSVLALMLLLALGFVTLTDARAPKAETGSHLDLTGRVQADDGAPLEATVFVYTAGPKTGTSTFCPSCYPDCRKRVTNDVRGKFKIESLDPQLLFRILVVAAGYEPKFVAKVDPAKEPVLVELKASSAADAAPDKSLHGRMVDEKGNPIEGAVVYSHGIHRKDGGGTWGTLPGVDPLAVTDAKGEFLIRAQEGFETMDVKVEARALANKTFTTLRSGDERHDLKMTEGATVSGRVMFNGHPLNKVSVGIVSVDRGMENFTGNFEIGTDSEGRFAFMNVPPNVDYYIYGMMHSIKQYGAIPATTIHVGGDGKTTQVGDLVAVAGHRLAGRVVLSDGKSIPPKTRLLVSREGAWDSMQMALDKDGGFDTPGIPTGGVSLSVRVPGYRVSGRNASLDRLNPFMLVGRMDQDLTNMVFLLEKGKELQPDYSVSAPDEDQPRNQQLHGTEAAPGHLPHSHDWALSGRVTDSESGAAVEHFQVIPGNMNSTLGQTHWDNLRGGEGTNGTYTTYIDRRWGEPMLQVRADGYLPVSVPLTPVETASADVALKKGAGPEGTVLLPDGKPAADVSVLLICLDDQNFNFNPKGELKAFQNPTRLTKTDDAGHFSFAPELDMRILAAAAPDGFKEVSVESLKTNKTITLEAYGRIKGTLRRKSGPGKREDLDLAFAEHVTPIGRGIFMLGNHVVTDDAGGFDFDNVPPGKLRISYRQSMRGGRMQSWMNKELQDVTLKPGETLEVNIEAPDLPAPGSVNARFPVQVEPVRTPGVELKGRVLSPDGKPAADAQVALRVEGKFLQLGKATFRSGGPGSEDLLVHTGPAGEFTLPMYDKAMAVIALSDAGFAKVTPKELQSSPEIRLQPWGRIEGTLHIGRKLGTNEMLVLGQRFQMAIPDVMYDPSDFTARTDEHGHFVITFVPPGEQRLMRQLPMPGGGWSGQPVDDVTVKAGGVTEVKVGGNGVTVTGKVKLAEAHEPVDWKDINGTIHTTSPQAMWRKFGQAKTEGERKALQQSEEYQKVMRAFHTYLMTFSADGSFVAEDVPPGRYELDVIQVKRDDNPMMTRRDTIGHKQIIVKASDDKSNDGVVDLGLLQLETPKLPSGTSTNADGSVKILRPALRE